jgi:DNA polymerase-3 subunit beta
VIFLRLFISQQVLSDALQYTATAKTNSIIPQHSGVKLHAGPQGLTLTSSNSGFVLQYEITFCREEVKVQGHGDIVVPSRYFAELVRHLPPGRIELEITPNRKISVKSDHSFFTLQGTDSKEFPRFADIGRGDKITVENHLLRSLIRRTSFAAATSESRPVLTGISLRRVGKQVRLAATDSIRLSLHVLDDSELA